MRAKSRSFGSRLSQRLSQRGRRYPLACRSDGGHGLCSVFPGQPVSRDHGHPVHECRRVTSARHHRVRDPGPEKLLYKHRGLGECWTGARQAPPGGNARGSPPSPAASGRSGLAGWEGCACACVRACPLADGPRSGVPKLTGCQARV